MMDHAVGISAHTKPPPGDRNGPGGGYVRVLECAGVRTIDALAKGMAKHWPRQGNGPVPTFRWNRATFSWCPEQDSNLRPFAPEAKDRVV